MQLASTILLIQTPLLSAFRGAPLPFKNYGLFGKTEPHALVKQVRLSGAGEYERQKTRRIKGRNKVLDETSTELQEHHMGGCVFGEKGCALAQTPLASFHC